MTGPGLILRHLAVNLPLLAGAGFLLVVALRRWRDRRTAACLLTVAGLAMLASSAVWVPVERVHAAGWREVRPLGTVLLEFAGWRPHEGPHWSRWPAVRYASWGLLAVAAACGLLAALPAPAGRAGSGGSSAKEPA